MTDEPETPSESQAAAGAELSPRAVPFLAKNELTTAARLDQAVAKANEAITIRPKRGKLTLLSRRIYNALLYNAQRLGVDNPTYTIALADLIEDARFNSNNTELLKSHIRDMQATTIEWHTSSGGAQRWTSTQLIGTVHIHEPGRGQTCTITWTYPDPIRERLVKPAHYTRVLLEISSTMRSYATAVLYELGLRYLTSPGGLTMREDLLWWAAVLTGRSDIKKVVYRDFNRFTLKKALAELDALCADFRMELIEHKMGRRVEELQFRVVRKAQTSLEGMTDSGRNVFDLSIIERLVTIGYKRADAQDLYAATDEGVLRAALEHVEQRMKNTALEPLKSPPAYLRDALKKQYAGSAGEAGNSPTTAVVPQPSPAERIQQLRDEWRLYKSGQARSLFEEMPEADQSEKIAAFEAECLPELASPIARAWRRDRINSRVAATSFFRWLAISLWPGEVTDKELLEFAISRRD